MVLLSARIRIIHSLLFVALTSLVSLNAAEVLQGDDYAAAGTTFSFPVNKITRDETANLLFIGAASSGGGIYAFSGVESNGQRIQPLAPETVTLNNTAAQPNPLFNDGIAFLDMLEATDGKRSPIMVLTSDLTRLYLVKDFNNFTNMSIFSTSPLLDFNGQVTDQIVGIAGYEGQLRSAAIVALAPNYTGIFGDIGSAFSAVSFQQSDEKIQVEGSNQETVRITYGLTQFPQVSFTRSSSTVAIGDPVTSITNAVAMDWNLLLQVGYVGMQVIGGADYSDGALSVMIANVNTSGIITLRSFAPASAFDSAGDQIIGGLGSSIPLSVQYVANMDTSTGLSYLIVQGGNGTPDETSGSVYALPIINMRNKNGVVVEQANHGMLASKNSSVFTFYDGRNPSRFIRRRFLQPAVTPADTPRSTDVAARVGGGPIAQGGVIQSLNVVHDGVIITVNEGAGYYNECQTGMFISRPLFDANGVITAWTPWERMGGVAEPVFRSVISTDTGNITYFTGADAASINTISRTQWGFGSDPGLNTFADQINTLYPVTNGGVQGLVDVPFGTPGLNGISMLIVGGNQSVTLTQVGSTSGMQQCPETGDFAANALTFQNGTISETITNSPLMLTIQGGALNNVGPIVTAAIGTNAYQGYLFVGGSRGLAVLTQPNGNGWDAMTGLGPNFAGLTNGMAFQMLGNYSFVRNLIVDGNFLYVVSAKRVDRIDLTTAPLFTATTIASSSSLVFDTNDTILDGIFSSKLGLLATSKGVFRTSNGNDVSGITVDDNAYWTTLQVPTGIVPPQQFFVSSTTGNPTDFATNNGGMLHLLSAYLGASRARVNRFAVADISNTPIDNNTVLPLSDGEIEGYNSAFLTFNGFRATYTCDGALSLYSIGRSLLISPYVRTRSLRAGGPAPLDNGNGTLIGQVLRSSTSGSWLVAGDFGIRINE